MNPVLIALILIGCIVVWFTLFPLFTKIGNILTKRWDKTFNEDEEENNENEEDTE